MTDMMKRTATTLTLPALFAFFLAFFLGFMASAGAQETRLQNYNFEEVSPVLWQLPKQLKDISGLALTPDSRLFAHQQKRGIVWEIDWQKGTLGKSFHLGKGVKSDFEGIAIVGTRFYMVTRKGGVVHFREGFAGEGKPFSTYDTGAGNFCETEGVTGRPGTTELLLLCRKPKKGAPENQITIFAWDTVAKQEVTAPFLVIPLPPELEGVQPSGIEAWADGSGFLVIATGERFLIDIGWDGVIRGWRTFPKGLHKNPAGLTITRAGDIIIADQGSPAQVTVYQTNLPEEN